MTDSTVRGDVSPPNTDISDLAVGSTSPPATQNVRGDTGSSASSPVSSPATCGCDFNIGVYCHEGKRLDILRRRGEKLAHQYNNSLPLRIAVGDLADHLRVDRASVLTAITKLRGKSNVRSQTRIP